MTTRLPLDIDLVGKILLAKDDSGLKKSDLLELMSAETGLSKGTLTVRIRRYDEGHIFGDRLTNTATEKEELIRLRNFAIYLRILGIDPKDPVIKGVRNYDPRFVYTKLSSQKQGKRYDQASDSVA